MRNLDCPASTHLHTDSASHAARSSFIVFAVPDGVDSDKIEASFKNGVLSVTLPKSADAQRAEKKIAVKAA